MSEERQDFTPNQEAASGRPVIPQENEPAMPVPPAPEMPTGQPEAGWTAVPGEMPPAPPQTSGGMPPAPPVPDPPKAPRGQRRYLWFVGIFAAVLVLVFVGYTVFCGVNGGDTGLAPQMEPSAQEGQESRPDWPDVDPFGEEKPDPDENPDSSDADSELEKPLYPAPEIAYSNSGGPLLNLYGQVIGINSSKIMATGYEGLGFAIPTQSAQQIVSDLISCGYVRGRPRLGFTGYDTAASRDGSVPAGFTIDSIGEDSDFTRAGARRGDIITAVNGEEVSGLTELQGAVFQYAPGDTVTMTLYRPDEGRYLDIEVKLLADAGETQD